MGRPATSQQTSATLPAMYRAALPNPGEWSVTARSLSIVLGMPITAMPFYLHRRYSLPQVSMVPLPPFMRT